MSVTVGGNRVIGLEYRPKTFCGITVTFPFKGTVVLREKPLRTSYEIWTEHGESDPVWHKNADRNLVIGDYERSLISAVES